jgi:hypothetical protein
MNLVALLITPAVVKVSYGVDADLAVRVPVAVVALAVIVVAGQVSERRGIVVGDEGAAAGRGGSGGAGSSGGPAPGTAEASAPARVTVPEVAPPTPRWPPDAVRIVTPSHRRRVRGQDRTRPAHPPPPAIQEVRRMA